MLTHICRYESHTCMVNTAPPKALDDEEIQFIRDLEEREAASQQRRKEQHNEDLAGFCTSALSSVHSLMLTLSTPYALVCV